MRDRRPRSGVPASPCPDCRRERKRDPGMPETPERQAPGGREEPQPAAHPEPSHTRTRPDVRNTGSALTPHGTRAGPAPGPVRQVTISDADPGHVRRGDHLVTDDVAPAVTGSTWARPAPRTEQA